MTDPNLYGNYPSFLRRCDDCNKSYRPANSNHRTCGCTNKAIVRDFRVPMGCAWDDQLGLPALPPTEEQKERWWREALEREREPVDCGCEPCHFDLRTLPYVTIREDPIFEGTRCRWHDQIRGRVRTDRKTGDKLFAYIYISCAKEGKTPVLTCDIGDRPEAESLRKKLGWDAYHKDFGPSEIDTFAKIIGAKKR